MKSLFTICLILVLPFLVSSQDWEAGLIVGGSNYQGDLSPQLVVKETHLATSIFVKKNLSQFFSTSWVFTKATISGNDANFDFLASRNLSFQSSITELSWQLEFNFFPFSIGLHPNNFTPFVYTGISVFRFSPVTEYGGTIVKLSGLDTEARKLKENRNKSYALIQPSIPIGGGLKFRVNDRMNFSLLVVYNKTFTDYLDDVSTVYYDKDILLNTYGELSALLSDRSNSQQTKVYNGKQRGRSDMNDWYIFYGISLSYRIKNAACAFDF